MKATQNQNGCEYADSSKIGMHGHAGARVYCQVFAHYILIGTEEIAFEGKVKAIN